MNDVVTAAGRSRRVLVTGFGPFPGAETNPTLDVLRLLAARGVAGVDLAFTELPVTFAGVGPALNAAALSRPHAILLLGLARRRTGLSVETLARNIAGKETPDVDGVVPANSVLIDDAPTTYEATWPAQAVLDALIGAGHVASLSADAGDYVCNAALFHALHARLAPIIGFLHVPPAHESGAATVDAFTAAARLTIAVLVGVLLTQPRAQAAARPSPDKMR